MRANDGMENASSSAPVAQIGFYLTDTTTSDRGNTLVLPGSHLKTSRLPRRRCVESGGRGADLRARRLRRVHRPPGLASRSPNLCDETRKVVWFGYGYRWLRPKDQMTVAHLYPQLDPVRRQILGDGLSNNGTYDPVDGDVPLRAWLKEHSPAEAERTLHGRSQSRPPAMVRGKNTGRM